MRSGLQQRKNLKVDFLKQPKLILTLFMFAGIAVIAPCQVDYPAWAAKKGIDQATVEPAEDNLKEGLRRLKSGNYEGAADSFMQSIYFSRNHYNPPAWLYLGLARKSLRDYPKAIEALNTHLSQVTENAPDARVDLAECLINLGEFKKARDEIIRAKGEAQPGQYARTRYAMGLLEERMGEPGRALDNYISAMGCCQDKNDDVYGPAYMGKARSLMKLRQFKEAVEDYQKMLNGGVNMRSIDQIELYTNLGNCLYRRGDHQGAIDHWLYAVKLNPDSFDAHLSLASVFDEEKHITSAIREYENAIRCAPGNYDSGKLKARLQYLQGQIAPKEFERPIRPSPLMRQEQQPAALPSGETGF